MTNDAQSRDIEAVVRETTAAHFAAEKARSHAIMLALAWGFRSDQIAKIETDAIRDSGRR